MPDDERHWYRRPSGQAEIESTPYGGTHVVSVTAETGPKVVFIGGYGRSGSTLLDRILGSIDGFLSVGELRHIWQEGFVENRRCGCGECFHDCPFWTDVSARAFDRFGGIDAAEVLAVKARVDQYWRVGQLTTGMSTRARRRDLAWYGERLQALYESIADVSGADAIVDSTKDVSHGYVLATLAPPIDLRLIHLVRDSRGVAWSWQRKKHNPGSGRDMNQYSLARSSLEWLAINALTAGHRRLGTPYVRVQYERLVSDPGAELDDVLSFLDEGDRANPVDHRRSVDLVRSHTVAGNPNRFTTGSIEIRADDEWRRAMPRRDRVAVTALTAPGLVTFANR